LQATKDCFFSIRLLTLFTLATTTLKLISTLLSYLLFIYIILKADDIFFFKY